MGYSVQNNETGEPDYIQCDYSQISLLDFDKETGEPCEDEVKVHYVKLHHFQIPKKYLRETVCEEFEKEMTGDYKENFQPNSIKVKPASAKNDANAMDKDDYIKMYGVKNDILLGFNRVNYHLLLLPTLFFNIYWAVFIVVFETFLHIWAHKKNNLNMNKEIFFRSPFHFLSSEFCAICQSESEDSIRVFQRLHKTMRKARHSKTLKDVTKAIS